MQAASRPPTPQQGHPFGGRWKKSAFLEHIFEQFDKETPEKSEKAILKGKIKSYLEMFIWIWSEGYIL